MGNRLSILMDLSASESLPGGIIRVEGGKFIFYYLFVDLKILVSIKCIINYMWIQNDKKKFQP